MRRKKVTGYEEGSSAAQCWTEHPGSGRNWGGPFAGFLWVKFHLLIVVQKNCHSEKRSHYIQIILYFNIAKVLVL